MDEPRLRDGLGMDLATVVHDLRQPLTAIRGLSQLGARSAGGEAEQDRHAGPALGGRRDEGAGGRADDDGAARVGAGQDADDVAVAALADVGGQHDAARPALARGPQRRDLPVRRDRKLERVVEAARTRGYV